RYQFRLGGINNEANKQGTAASGAEPFGALTVRRIRAAARHVMVLAERLLAAALVARAERLAHSRDLPHRRYWPRAGIPGESPPRRRAGHDGRTPPRPDGGSQPAWPRGL